MEIVQMIQLEESGNVKTIIMNKEKLKEVAGELENASKMHASQA